MLKKISAALLIASLVTAPAMAATVIKAERAPATKAATTKTVTIKPSVANAKAQAPAVKKSHFRKKVSHRHVRKHVKMATTKKMTVKRVSAAPAKTVIVKKKV